ncbi:hypothetical protein [Membranihabitans marinus]|uniref:hypothetical protein n=1 Tax=Membranihabitans marinus TaxID=1227546 RepID=UPI001F34EE91|nr:hypothetical protein [Membranihabitans marinus]
MKFKNTVFLLFFILGLAAILVGYFYSRNEISSEDYFDIERQMLVQTSFDPSLPLKEEWLVNGIQVSRYFDSQGDNYKYKGGLKTNLVIDETYSSTDVKNQLEDIEEEEVNVEGYLSYEWLANNVYVLVDKIDVEGVSNFLKALDEYRDSHFENMVIDLRFIREVDIPLTIRMLNQWCALENFTLDSIQSTVGDREIISSGKPFFQADEYYFLVSSHSPLPLLHLLKRLTSHSDYHMVGQIPNIPSRLCVEKTYSIEDRRYSICDFVLTDNSQVEEYQAKSISNDAMIENYKSMSELLFSISTENKEEQLKTTMKDFLELLSQKN